MKNGSHQSFSIYLRSSWLNRGQKDERSITAKDAEEIENLFLYPRLSVLIWGKNK